MSVITAKKFEKELILPGCFILKSPINSTIYRLFKIDQIFSILPASSIFMTKLLAMAEPTESYVVADAESIFSASLSLPI